MKQISKVSIALKPSVYSTFRALNNTVSYTLGEYVDNAVQSYLNNKSSLFAINPTYKLEIKITVDWTDRTITIIDNAAGINIENYERAFEPAHIPLDATGLNEFGMGMKTASVWLANNWCVYTKALGESVERFTEFDLHKVTSEDKEELIVTETPKPEEVHYTKIVLSNLSNHAPTTNQMDKIRRHLSSIYRKFLRNNEIDIVVNDVYLTYPDYEILYAPYHKTPTGENILWKKEINFELGEYKAKGFIALLKTMQQTANGIALLRRGRVIQGGGDEKYYPQVLCGQVGSPRYKRVFGELELEGFDVSFNKNGFRDEDDLYAFMEAIKEELTSPEFDLYGQAQYFLQKTKEDNAKIAKEITTTLKKETKPRELAKRVQEAETRVQNSQYIVQTENLIRKAETLDSHAEPFQLNGINYTLRVDLVTETSVDMLYSVSQESTSEYDSANSKQIVCKINLAHSFFTRFDLFKKANNYQSVIAIFKSLALAEIMAPNRGTINASNIRLLFNNYMLQ
ncbi:MAG: ATP-binding protein [Planctomycetaceae bacterium]|nr:ATP-binding protein [Planctomycetaceae bacterium]